jgi:hypothetical protein
VQLRSYSNCMPTRRGSLNAECMIAVGATRHDAGDIHGTMIMPSVQCRYEPLALERERRCCDCYSYSVTLFSCPESCDDVQLCGIPLGHKLTPTPNLPIREGADLEKHCSVELKMYLGIGG